MTTAARRLLTFVLICVAAAVVFVRLGFWQLSRLHQRRARNAVIAARLVMPRVPITTLAADSASRLRRATLTGEPDYAHEIVIASRSHEGSPGVNLLTPVRVAGHDTVILVNRGWVYAPDGVAVNGERWRERSRTFAGYAELMPNNDPRASVLRQRPLTLAQIAHSPIAHALPYPVSSLYLVATVVDSATAVADQVARLPEPVLDEGPHLGYAIQWFAFAAIALVGAVVIVRVTRAAERARAGNGRLSSP